MQDWWQFLFFSAVLLGQAMTYTRIPNQAFEVDSVLSLGREPARVPLKRRHDSFLRLCSCKNPYMRIPVQAIMMQFSASARTCTLARESEMMISFLLGALP